MMKCVVFLLASATTAFAQVWDETPTGPIDPKIDFRVSVVGNQNEFHIGEIIPIKLSFSSRAKKRYQLNEAHYDRSGRMEYERFTVTPSDGAVDPLAEYFASGFQAGGGLTGFVFLKPKSWTIDLDLNEWVRFTTPGEYRLRVASNRVELVDRSRPQGTSTVTAVSNELTLKILPRDPTWENRKYDEAVAILKNPSSIKEDRMNSSPAHRALETLRFLGTKEATRELANQLHGEDPGRRDFVCYIGLISSPERAVAREALENELVETDRPIDDTSLDALTWLENHNGTDDPDSGKGEGKVLRTMVAALTNKRGEALRVSLCTLLDQIWARDKKQLLPKEDVEKLVSQLIEIFDQLPAKQRANLLDWRWEQIKRPALLPLLQRSAQSETRELAAVALRRWFQLDRDGARSAIISEISQPKPRFGARELGMLSDQTLPEVDQLLIDHLQGDEEFQSTSNLASLIARYATRAILPQVLAKLDPIIGKWGCYTENPLLAYILRVDPELARPRIEKAIAAQGKNSMCDILGEIAVIHWDPVLENIAVRALDNPFRQVAVHAAEVLGKFGSAAVETVLWQHYEKWCKRWAGRELQVNLQAVDVQRTQEVGTDDLSVGRSLAHAIVNGHRWLTDEPKLQRLLAMSKVPNIRSDLDRYVEKSRHSPPTLVIFSCGSELMSFSARVAHNDLNSLDALEEKLGQFAPGTTFELSLPFDKTDQSCADDLRAFLAAHGFTVTAPKEREGN